MSRAITTARHIGVDGAEKRSESGAEGGADCGIDLLGKDPANVVGLYDVIEDGRCCVGHGSTILRTPPRSG